MGAKKVADPVGWAGRELSRHIQQGLLAEGVAVSIAKLCAWFGIPRRMVYYKPVKAAPKIDPRFSELIKKIPLLHALQHVLPGSRSRRNPRLSIAQWPGFWALKRTRCKGSVRSKAGRSRPHAVHAPAVQRVRKRAVGMLPRVQAVPSAAAAPNERWSTDLARICTGEDGWASLALVIGCHTRELIGILRFTVSYWGTRPKINREQAQSGALERYLETLGASETGVKYLLHSTRVRGVGS